MCVAADAAREVLDDEHQHQREHDDAEHVHPAWCAGVRAELSHVSSVSRALTAASSLPSKAAVRRLVRVRWAGCVLVPARDHFTSWVTCTVPFLPAADTAISKTHCVA